MIVDEPLDMIQGDSSYLRSGLVTEIPVAHSNGQMPLQNPRRRRMGRCVKICSDKFTVVYILCITDITSLKARDRLSPGPDEHVNSVSVVEMRIFGLI